MIADVVLLNNDFTTIIQSEKPVFCLSAYIIKPHSFEQELLSVLNSIETKFKEVQLTIENRIQLFCKAHIHVYLDRVTITYTDDKDNKVTSYTEKSSTAIKLINDEFNKNTTV